MNSLWDIRVFLGLVPKESHYTTDITGIWRGMFQLSSVPVMSDLVVILLRSIVVLTPNDNFWAMPLLNSVSDMILLCRLYILQVILSFSLSVLPFINSLPHACHMPCPSFLHLMPGMIFGELYNSPRSSLCIFVLSGVSSFRTGPSSGLLFEHSVRIVCLAHSPAHESG